MGQGEAVISRGARARDGIDVLNMMMVKNVIIQRQTNPQRYLGLGPRIESAYPPWPTACVPMETWCRTTGLLPVPDTLVVPDEQIVR